MDVWKPEPGGLAFLMFHWKGLLRVAGHLSGRNRPGLDTCHKFSVDTFWFEGDADQENWFQE